jgi:hypothetical protein
MDKSGYDFGSVGCGFDSCLGHLFISPTRQSCPMKTNLISRLMKPRLLSRIRNKIRSFFFLDQWTVLVARDVDYKSLYWSGFKTLAPPQDRFWADPFVWQHDNKYYVFLEELPYATERGYIVCLTLDEDLNIISNQIVLEKPYHLSYPFIFEYNGQVYMLPETKHNNRIELYRCTHFPDQWQFEKALIEDVRALDSTLLEANGKWWLFANIHEEGGSSWDTLYLYYSDSPLSGQWTPHPRNPIVKDIYSARPAGRIFHHEGRLVRPSQNCSVDYGYAMNFNQIVTLSETEYAETHERAFKPPATGKILATHTFNSLGGLTAIDAIQLRLKF